MAEPTTKPRTKAAKRAAATSRRARQRAQQRDAGLVMISASIQADTAERIRTTAHERRCTLGQAVDSYVKTADIAERKARWRSRAAAEGRQVVTVALDAATAHLLRDLARQNKRSIAEVIKLGSWAAKHQLDAMAARTAAGR